MNKFKDRFISIYIILNLIYILIGAYLRLNKKILLETFSYGYIVFLLINIIIILILFFKKKYKKNKIDIFLILIIVFAIISTIFAYNPKKSLFGTWERYEGLFTICYYMTILFLTSFIKKEDRKKIIYAILIFGIIHTLFGFFEKLRLFNVITVFYKGNPFATGFTKNPNFLGTIITICLGYSLGLFFNCNKREHNIIYLTLIYFFLVGLFLTDTLSCVVSLIFILILLLIYSIKSNKIKKYIVVFLLSIFSLLFLHLLNMTTLISDIYQTKNETSNIIKGNMDDNYGTGRMYVWKNTIKVIPKYLLHGVGVDCFSNILDGKPIIRGKDHHIVYDKAHNEYLQILVTMGIFSLISYLCLHFIIIKEGIKNKELYLLLPVIGYLVQAQFNISVIEVAPIFYISLGLLINRN